MNAKQRRQNRRNVPSTGRRIVFDLESHWPTMDVNVLKERPAGGGLFIDMDFTKLEERIEAYLAEPK